MHYSFFFTVEPDNDVNSPVVETIKLASGILRGVHLSIPSGVNNTVRCCILNDSVQLLPSNQDGYYSGDGVVIDASLWYDPESDTARVYSNGSVKSLAYVA